MLWKKFTPAMFRAKLAEGGYEDSTGANRAIGKMKTWKAKDVQAAKALVATHFGEPLKETRVRPKEAQPAATKKRPSAAAPSAKHVPAKKMVEQAPAPAPTPRVRPKASPKAPARTPSPSVPSADASWSLQQMLEFSGKIRSMVDALRVLAEKDKRYRPAVDRVIDAILNLNDAYGLMSAIARGDDDAVPELSAAAGAR
jgi:hypothetical protein